jgi:hypothetical protein
VGFTDLSSATAGERQSLGGIVATRLFDLSPELCVLAVLGDRSARCARGVRFVPVGPIGGGEMKTNTFGEASGSAPESAQRFAAQVEAAIADLEQRFPAGMGAVELALAERIRAALERLLECSRQLAKDGLIVTGSTGQPRPHQLLKTEQDLRREIGDSLQALARQAEQGALFAQARDLTRARPGRVEEESP